MLDKSYIRFGVHAMVMGANEVRDIVESEKKEEGEGEALADGDGIIVLEFNNFKSWVYSVKIVYDISSDDPEVS